MDPLKTKCVYETVRCGLVPVKVLRVMGTEQSPEFEIEVTREQGAYPKGHRTIVRASNVHPAANVRKPKPNQIFIRIHVPSTPWWKV